VAHHVPTYAKVHYRAVYPGIDLGLLRATSANWSTTSSFQSGADPERIVLGFQGAERLEINAEGELVLHAAGGAIRQRVPVIYQEDRRRQDKDRGPLRAQGRASGRLQGRSLRRQPGAGHRPGTLLFHLPRGSGEDRSAAIAVDAAGNAYVTDTPNRATSDHHAVRSRRASGAVLCRPVKATPS